MLPWNVEIKTGETDKTSNKNSSSTIIDSASQYTVTNAIDKPDKGVSSNMFDFFKKILGAKFNIFGVIDTGDKNAKEMIDSKIPFNSTLIGKEQIKQGKAMDEGVAKLKCLYLPKAVCSEEKDSLPASSRIKSATLADYWNGEAKWELFRTIDSPGIFSHGSYIKVLYDDKEDKRSSTWYWFGTTDDWGMAVQASDDQGETWRDYTVILTPQPGKAWEVYAADGTAFYDEKKNIWHLLFQCYNFSEGGGWYLCHMYKEGKDPAKGSWIESENPILKPGQLTESLCKSGIKCPGEKPYEDGTPNILDEKDGIYYFSFHGISYASGLSVRAIAKTDDFKNFIVADGSSDIPIGGIIDKTDIDRWREKWQDGSSIGAGYSHTLEEDNYYYQVIEGADVSLDCSKSPHWDWGFYRSDDLANISWESLPKNNPFIRSTGCNLTYVGLFRDETTGETFLNFQSLAEGQRRLYIYKLVLGLGKDDFSKDESIVPTIYPEPINPDIRLLPD